VLVGCIAKCEGDSIMGESVARIASVSAADAKMYQSRWEEVVSLMEAAAKVREQGRDSVGNVLP
jgi:hypothetical protein